MLSSIWRRPALLALAFTFQFQAVGAMGDAVEVTVERMAMPRPQQGPSGQMKHLSFEPGLQGRIYVYGGDYFGKPTGASYRREIWSVDFAANEWRLEAGYCPPDAATPWSRGRCQAGFAHVGGGRFLIVGGNYNMNHSNACKVRAEEIRSAYVIGWDGAYSIPEQDPANAGQLGGPYGQVKYGVWDAEKSRFLAIKGHGQIVEFRDGTWRRLPGLTGRYLWSAQGSQTLVERRWYMINELAGENGQLLYMDLDTDRLHTAADLPFRARTEQVGYETVTVAWWEARERLALYRTYDRGTLWLYDIDGGFERVDLPEEVYGRHLVADPAHDALVILGQTDGAWNDFDRYYWLIR